VAWRGHTQDEKNCSCRLHNLARPALIDWVMQGIILRTVFFAISSATSSPRLTANGAVTALDSQTGAAELS